ncbi:MAG: complex I NDUFA9 subunit family protein [Alphaproteobacteria bacterium]
MFHRRVTVFGGSGFVGRYLVKRLAAEGSVVRVAVRRPAEADFLKPLGAVGQIVPVAANVRDRERVAAAVAGVDAVVNLVGILQEGGGQTFDGVQAEGARTVAEAARDAGVGRLVQMSAIGADAGSESRYARTKAAGEAAVREAFPTASIVRPSIVVGPEDDFFNRFGRMAVLSPALPLIGGGVTRFQPVVVGDVADALMAILRDPATAGQTYELGGPQVYSFRELMELLLRITGRRRCLFTLPFGLADFQARFLEKLPRAPLTRDQVKLLQRDNVVSGSLPGLTDLGIAPTAIEVILPTYLERFRRGGRFVRSRGR